MKRKIYAPVTEFEPETSLWVLYLAWGIVDEAGDYFRMENLVPTPASGTLSQPPGEGLADKLARRAETAFAKDPSWKRLTKVLRGRAFILMFTRHWPARILSSDNPVSSRQIPESFKIGRPLPMKMAGMARCGVGTSRRNTEADTNALGRKKDKLVHGLDGLTPRERLLIQAATKK
jgi:hypothetical protein